MDFQDPEDLVSAAQMIREAYLENAYSAPLSVKQQETLRNDLVIGPLWVSKCPLPSSKDDTSRDALLRVVDDANVHQMWRRLIDAKVPYYRPASGPLNLEWVGFRSNVQEDTPEPLVTEKEKFDKLTVETKSSSTVFYIYSGTQNTPSCYRKMVVNLSQATGTKVMMVEQRLAPQNPFPAALLDVFQAYLALFYPPLGSHHKPTPASDIVIAADSSGGSLALGFLQVLLQLQRREQAVTVHGTTIHPSWKSPIVPAGMALLSPICDASNAFPSMPCPQSCTCAHVSACAGVGKILGRSGM
ncbi:benzoate 4-monooxygenase cytochrome P450 [Penicillium frequentans]|uniref:Benzoate 4-monooxygenase cytochrome P450 n=1 Tax=Penicillium frequentans TaxID=3151616 RepID=A0AAD6CU68_9EURO|nr:benzoate 4-monooxygenase cytochrome P450 [Penicillium glabrum]